MATYVHSIMGQPFLIGTMSQLSSPLPPFSPPSPPHTQIDINLDPLIDALLCSSLVSHFSLFKILPPTPNRPASWFHDSDFRQDQLPPFLYSPYSVEAPCNYSYRTKGKIVNMSRQTVSCSLLYYSMAWRGEGPGGEGSPVLLFFFFFPFSPPFGINFNKSSFRVSKLDHNR